MNDSKQEILEGLEPLFEKADRLGLWFYSNYQDMWLHPDELRDYHSKGQFLWGAVNWTLKHPDDKLFELLQKKKNVEVEIENFKIRMIR